MSSGGLLRHSRYVAGEVLGRGAQGTVLRVVDKEAPWRALVAKIVAAAPDALDAEFALLSRLSVAGLARVHDLARDAESGARFLVEDFVDGPDARAWVSAAEPRARSRRLAQLVADVAATLAPLHEAGFVHGDLKPAHVRVLASGRAVLLDLGAALAHAGRPGASLVTPAFAAPEVLAGGATSPAADLYGLGALAWAVACGEPPPRKARPTVRAHANWIAPSLASVIDVLVAEHPADRPRDARDTLALLGRDGAVGPWDGRRGAPAGRVAELGELVRHACGVRYLVGPPGSGKSHLARELVTTSLLAGRATRLVRFPYEDARLVARLAAFLRGAGVALAGANLLVLDDLHAAPVDVAAALDAFRCRTATGAAVPSVAIVATARAAPEGAEVTRLGPLSAAAFAELAAELGVAERDVAATREASGGLPGWLAAARGRVPLTRDAALERTRTLTPGAREALAVLALAGGDAPSWLFSGREEGLRALLASSLATRRADGEAVRYALTSPRLATDLAEAIGDYAVADALADAALARGDADAPLLLAIASAPTPPARRTELFARAAARAREDGLRAEETEALLALASDPRTRTAEALTRVERLTRDAGAGASHPQVLEWLEELGGSDARVLPLALRRRAEAAARAGDAVRARTLADEALSAARGLGDRAGEAFALATAGAVALYRADWPAAERALTRARRDALGFEGDDPEEIARLDHNLGVVLLYSGRNAEAAAAFERALGVKRTLGDKAGCRSCLLNLGLAGARAARFEEAERALQEALLLARALGQVGGRAWCLAARADLEIRRGRPREAAAFIAEADAMGEELPAAVRADLCILRAEVALADGHGRAALDVLDALDEATRRDDALVDARALVLEARAWLAVLPAARHRAARAAVRAIRRARAAALAEPENNARDALRAARTRGREPMRYEDPSTNEDRPGSDDEALWEWLGALGVP